MSGRQEILRDLIELARPVPTLRRELAVFPWDSAELVRLDRAQLTATLRRYLSGKISSQSVSEWAEALEGRDDVGYDQQVADVLAELASPEINGTLTGDRARELIALLT
jgi:hypothetical protein